MEKTSISEVIETLIKALVDEPEEVEVTESQGEKTLVIEARVSKQDMGKVIGKRGRTIDSLRTIVAACGAKKRQRCIFQIIEDEDDDR